MKTGYFVFAVTFGLIFLAAQTLFSLAQGPGCGSADRIISEITGPKYRETRMLELMTGTARLQLYSNMKTGTWTLIAHQANGIACVIGGGTSIKPMREVKPKERSS